MDFQDNVKRVHKIMTERFKTYVEAIKEVYGEYMGPYNLKRLNEIVDYGNHVIIGRNGAINAHANYNGVYLPIEAYKALEELSKFKEYGINKNHKLYDESTMIVNDNTFYDYINHVVVTGSTPEDYYEDLLLHETMHFCGSGGASALKEGMNEYLTRKIALQHGFRTSCCGYPKEVKIVDELAKVFGEDIVIQLAFINDEEYIERFIDEVLGKEEKNLYIKVKEETEREFQEKYHRYMGRYDGVEGIKLKAYNYAKIDYSKAYDLINNFKKNNKR